MTNLVLFFCELLPQAKSYGELQESGIKVCEVLTIISTLQQFWPI